MFPLLVGATIGILGSVLGYCLNHFLKLRERSIVREFEMQKEGREFYLLLYAHLANLADLVSGYLKAVEGGEVQVIVKGTFKSLDPDDVTSQFKQAFENYVQFWGKSRMAGYELFLTDDVSERLEEILRHSWSFYKQTTWDSKGAQNYIKKADSTMERIAEVLGVRRRR